jgi:hypothetical protein
MLSRVRPQTIAGRAKGCDGEVEQPQLVHPLRRRGEAVQDGGQRQGDQNAQEDQHRHRRSRVDGELEQVDPDDGAQAAMEAEDEGHAHQQEGRDQHPAGVHVQEQQHRDGDGGEVEPRPASQHPADQFVNGRHALGVEPGHEHAGDHERGDQGGDVGAEIGEVAAVAIVRSAQEGRRGLGGRQHRDRR